MTTPRAFKHRCRQCGRELRQERRDLCWKCVKAVEKRCRICNQVGNAQNACLSCQALMRQLTEAHRPVMTQEEAETERQQPRIKVCRVLFDTRD